MKIIVRDEQGIKRCYAQVRDVTYLAERCNAKSFEKIALGKNYGMDLYAEDFFEVKNKAIAEIIDENPYIVDFSDMAKYDGFTLSRIILLSQSPMPSETRKKDEQHKVEDLVDIISFKNGMLTYPIPLLFDEKVIIDDGEMVFGSTTLPDYYLLRSANKEADLEGYIQENAESLFEDINPEAKMVSYDTLPLGDDLLVHFTAKKKIFSQLIKRITA